LKLPVFTTQNNANPNNQSQYGQEQNNRKIRVSLADIFKYHLLTGQSVSTDQIPFIFVEAGYNKAD
jgi:hypothetical protein